MMVGGGKFGWFLGLAFGTLVGMLFAPRKGAELRAKIKAERKRGGLGIAPLGDDMRHVGAELASLAKEVYESDAVSDAIEKGKKQMKQIADDVVGEVVDFDVSRIAPIKRGMRDGMAIGRKAAAKMAHKIKSVGAKAKRAIKKRSTR